MRVGEQEKALSFATLFVVHGTKAAVAVRVDQSFTVGLVGLPGFAKVFGDVNRAKTLVIVAHVQHDRAVAELRGLAFVSAAEGGSPHSPGDPMIGADHDCGEGNS